MTKTTDGDDTDQQEPGTSSAWPSLALGFVAGICGTLGTVYIGLLDTGVREREVSVQEMRIAFDMLQVSPEQAGKEYRNWACQVLEGHSKIDIDCDAAGKADFSSLRQTTVVAPGDPSKVDIGLFTCSEADDAKAERVFGSLKEAGVGTIWRKRWTAYDELSRESLSGRTTIVVDMDHPEKEELPRLRKALETAGYGDSVTVPNPGAESWWYVSIILCGV